MIDFLYRKFLKKWLWCSWRHRKHRCRPRIGVDDYHPNWWHCAKCWPCGEEIEKLFNSLPPENP